MNDILRKTSILIVVLAILLTFTILTGCAYNGRMSYNTSVVPQQVVDNVEKKVSIFLEEGSTARYNGDWIITSKHMSHMFWVREKHLHPTCDIMLVRDSGDNVVDTGSVRHGEPLYHVGYPTMQPMAVNGGEWLTDVILGKCQVSLSTAKNMSGMSGGGVYNGRGELIGNTMGIYYGPERDWNKKTVWSTLR